MRIKVEDMVKLVQAARDQFLTNNPEVKPVDRAAQQREAKKEAIAAARQAIKDLQAGKRVYTTLRFDPQNYAVDQDRTWNDRAKRDRLAQYDADLKLLALTTDKTVNVTTRSNWTQYIG